MSEQITGVQFDGKTIALLRELKMSLYDIARQAELEGSGVAGRADHTMRLIDSYISSCQTVYGQQTLISHPVALGSVMYDVASQMHAEIGCRVDIQTKAHATVATHARTLSGMLHAAAQALREITSNELILRSFESRDNTVGVGVFARDITLNNHDLARALDTVGSSHMPLAAHSDRSGIMLVIAEQMATALGGTLQAKRMGAFRGLVTTVPRSQQLTLI